MNETPKISYDDFAKVEIRAGKILSAEKIPDTDKLLKLSVDFGEVEVAPTPVVTPAVAPALEGSDAAAVPTASVASESSTCQTPLPKPRQIVSGIALYYPDPSVLVGKTCMFVTNLEPRTIRGYESNGMIFAVSTPEGAFSLLEPTPVDPSRGAITPGTRAK